MEAVTVGPTQQGGVTIHPPSMETPEEHEAFLKHYMPIKFGSPLFSKLQKKYWKHNHIKGMPLLFAIADFSSPGSMTHSQSALERYLYGFTLDEDEPKKIAEHKWGAKVIPSGFFDLPDARHISAVVSTTAGTISKFNRMGMLANFDTESVLIIREGTCIDQTPDATGPLLFKSLVNSPKYKESWIEGLNVYHNPHAEAKIPISSLPNAAHHFCDENGNRKINAPRFQPLASFTKLILDTNIQEAVNAFGDEAIRFRKFEAR